jgi:hypothetical protein
VTSHLREEKRRTDEVTFVTQRAGGWQFSPREGAPPSDGERRVTAPCAACRPRPRGVYSVAFG